jgi:hypothetical protein
MKQCLGCKKLEKENKKLQKTIEVLRGVILKYINQKYPDWFSDSSKEGK